MTFNDADKASGEIIIDTFSESIRYNGATVSAIFDDEYIDPLGIGGSEPSITLYETAVTSPAENDTVVRDSVTYLVVGPVINEGGGLIRLRLEKQ